MRIHLMEYLVFLKELHLIFIFLMVFTVFGQEMYQTQLKMDKPLAKIFMVLIHFLWLKFSMTHNHGLEYLQI